MKKILALFFTLFISAFLILGASAQVLPGINVLTGNENPLTFDEHTTLPSFISNAIICETPMKNEDGNAIMHYVNNSSSDYAAVGFSFNTALDSGRAYQISFKIYQHADEGFGKYKNLWIMKNGMSGWQRAENCGGFTANSSGGWLEYSYLIDTFDDLINSATGNTDTSDISKILFEWRYDTAESACINQKIYFDDISIVPAYFVTYIDEDGKTIREGYEALFGTKYVPQVTSEDKAKGIIGWSKENDNTADDSVILDNKDFTLYAVYDNTLYFNLESEKNMFSFAGDSTVITSNLMHRKGTEGITVSFSCNDNSVTLSDNGDGTADVVSVSEGLSKIVCTSSSGETDEIYILSDYEEGKEVMKIVKSVSNIDTDAKSESVTAVLFTALEKDTKIRWKSSSDCVTVSSTGNGTAILTPVSNGTAIITAYAENDESICDSFTVNVSGQREKEKVYELNVLVWGASLAKHPPAENLYWYGNWGMAASKEENDFIHRLVYYLEQEYYPSKVNLKILAESGFDTSINNDTSATTDYSSNQYFLNMENAIKEHNPNIIVTIRTGNLSNDVPVDIAYNAYSQLYDMVYAHAPDAIVVAHHCLLHHDSMKEELYVRLDERYTDRIFEVNDLDVHEKEENLAREWLELGQVAVANHWNDKGHDEVAKVTMSYLTKHIPYVLTPSFVYRPESIKISGKDTITEKGAAIQLYASAFPSDASDSVIWSVDNENVATVSKNGLVSAKNNGTVYVTATSTFDESVYATHKVTVTNQPAVYRVSYSKNTDDAVSGMPESFDYAGLGYSLSETIPERKLYTFLGWSLSAESDDCVTKIDVTENTTVYAVWKKTEGFEFEGTYTEDKLFSYGFDIDGGFHVEIKDSCLFTVCTSGEKVRFNSPEVDITNKNSVSFALACGYIDKNSTAELTVKTNSSEKTYVFPILSTDFVTYTADTSSLDGNITGFEIYVNSAPSNGSMFNIALDFVRFDSVFGFDNSEENYIFTDGENFVSTIADEGFTKIENLYKLMVISLDGGRTLEIYEKDAYIYSEKENAISSVNLIEFNDDGKFTKSSSIIYTNTSEGFELNESYSEKLTSYDAVSMRTVSPEGIRVKASVEKGFDQNEGVSEYGFIVARKDSITSGKINDVILDMNYVNSNLIVYGKAFCKNENIHKVFDSTDEFEIFTGVLTNTPKNKTVLTTPLIFRPYVKLSDNRIFYGAKIEASSLDVAIEVYNSESSSKEAKAAAKKIMGICEYDDKEILIPLDKLWE